MEMIWIIFNIVLLVVGICLIVAGGCIDCEGADTDDVLDLLVSCAGIIFLAFFVVSESLRWWVG